MPLGIKTARFYADPIKILSHNRCSGSKKKKKVSFSTGLTQYSSFSAGVFMNHEYFSFR